MHPIVVGVDGSETAATAADEAARLAEALGVPLHVVTASSGSKRAVGTAPDGGSMVYTGVEEAESLLASVAAKYRARVGEITTAVVDAKPAEALVTEAERVDASIIVVGNKRMQGAARFLGAIASDVAHHAPCSVHIVKTT